MSDLRERLVLDTSAYSRFRAGHTGVLNLMARAAVVIVPVVVLGELEAGFQLGKRTEENRQTLGDFLDESFVSVVDVTAVTSRHYGRIFCALRLAGTPIPINDIWIAATAVECGGHLVTFDRDFRRVPGLELTLLDADR